MPPASEPPPAIVRHLDLPYVADAWRGKNPDSSQTLDLYSTTGDTARPLIVWIHGGGWCTCGKQPEGERFALQWVPHGFVVASINYRHTPDAPFPAQIEDCHRAIAWLRAHAGEYHIDPDRVGVVGHSAGGHLCALLATGGIVDKPEPVQAAVCWSPPCDLDRERGAWPRDNFIWNPADTFARYFFPGGRYDKAHARTASPATHAHADMPPVLLVHGALDDIVPADQTVAFHRQLQTLDVESTLQILPEADHDLISPAASNEALEFFNRVLK
ncbi:MAG: alpha/beta hydrolase [Verrucomicrobiota bacterium]